MNIQIFERAVKLVATVKKLDAEIIDIEKMAELVANGQVEASFILNLQNAIAKNKDAEKVHINGDGEMVKGDPGVDVLERPRFMHLGGLGHIVVIDGPPGPPKSDKKYDHTLTQPLSESATLQIMGILIGEKKRHRQVLIDQLNAWGIKI